MKKEELVDIINRLRVYAQPLDEDGDCGGCCEPCDDEGEVAHLEDCEWIRLMEDIEDAQADA